MGLDRRDRLPDGPDVVHRDYILDEYEPVLDPTGRLHSASLLRHALRLSGRFERVWPVAERLSAELGGSETVWGVKYVPDGAFSVEFYFYHADARGAKSVTSLSCALAPLVRSAGRMDESLGYFMCSLELGDDVFKGNEAIWRVYFKSSASGRSAGYSYRVGARGLGRLENHYEFFEAQDPADVRALRERLRWSARSGEQAEAALLDPELLRCRRICYAVKPEWDALYFSRVPSPVLAGVLESRGAPGLAAALREHADGFAHLLWDVGLDFRRANGTLAVGKLGVYGFL